MRAPKIKVRVYVCHVDGNVAQCVRPIDHNKHIICMANLFLMVYHLHSLLIYSLMPLILLLLFLLIFVKNIYYD